MSITSGKFIYIFLDSFTFQKNLHYNILSRLFNACFTLHEKMHRISSLLAPRRIKRGGGGGIIYLFLPVASTCSSRIISSIDIFKLCKILADHDQCIQWCKEHNLLPSSIMCPRENCSNKLSLTRRASSRDGYE